MPHAPELDGLRAIAISLVFVGHFHLFPKYPGGYGVTLFFFLSGYLITSLLRLEFAETRRVDLPRFYLRRFLRINPPLWLSIGVMLAAIRFGFLDIQLDPQVVISQALFFSNYVVGFGHFHGLPSPLWSLAVEEHFYLVFPLLFALASRRGLSARQIAIACVIACGAVLAGRLYNVMAAGIVTANYYWTHTRIDSILFGCVLALWSNPLLEAKPPFRPGLGWFVAGLALTAASFAMQTPILREGVRYTVQGIALFPVFFYLLDRKGLIQRVLLARPLQIVGRYSYTIYLIHYAAIVWVQQHMAGMSELWWITASCAMSMAYAALMYACVERPLGRIRHRLNLQERATGTPPLFDDATNLKEA